MRAEDRWEAPGAEPQQAFPQETRAKRPFLHLKRSLGLQGKALACQSLLQNQQHACPREPVRDAELNPRFAAGAPGSAGAP